jgi:hypothetical protein
MRFLDVVLALATPGVGEGYRDRLSTGLAGRGLSGYGDARHSRPGCVHISRRSGGTKVPEPAQNSSNATMSGSKGDPDLQSGSAQVRRSGHASRKPPGVKRSAARWDR